MTHNWINQSKIICICLKNLYLTKISKDVRRYFAIKHVHLINCLIKNTSQNSLETSYIPGYSKFRSQVLTLHQYPNMYTDSHKTAAVEFLDFLTKTLPKFLKSLKDMLVVLLSRVSRTREILEFDHFQWFLKILVKENSSTGPIHFHQMWQILCHLMLVQQTTSPLLPRKNH